MAQLRDLLSVCIIAKNEEKNIRSCLESLVPYQLPVILADTGSTDNTLSIARAYTENIYEFPWCDDFSAAKNFAVSKAKTPFVLVIDSDEYVEEFDTAALLGQLQEKPLQVGRIRRKNRFTRKGVLQENQEWLNRIFAKEHYRYEGKIHEQVEACAGGKYDTYLTSVVISHSGYDLTEEERRQKAVRNITLLLQELARLKAEQKDEKKFQEQLPYIYYQLGKSYYLAKEYEKSCEYFSEGLSFDLEPKLEYVIDMVETYGYALINSGQAGEALLFEGIYDTFGNTADFQFLMGLIYMNNEMFDRAVGEFLKATEHKECRSKGVNSYASFYNIGVIYECLGDRGKALEYYDKCGDYKPAVQRRESIISE